MFRKFRICGFVAITMCVLAAINANINDTLSYWETLTVSSLHRRTVKRGTTSALTVEFDSFGRHFSLILRRNLSILAPGFQIFVFEADGTSRQVSPDFDLYRGAVIGDSGSFISAYFNADRALSASIRTSTETYSVEPAVNLVPDAPSDTMIIYRESDLKWDNSSRCGYVDDDKNSKTVKETITEKHHTHRNRSKRQACESFGKTCLLYIAADPRFVEGKGRHSIKETSTYMLKVIDYVDNMFRRTVFPECGRGYGYRVMKMNIFQSPTKGHQYTEPQISYNYLKFLQLFGEDAENEQVCHGHVFTQQSFMDEGSSVLGLAFLANPALSKVGGVCSRSKSKGILYSKNVGWTTFALGKKIVSDLQGTLVTAHEFGHSWGAAHDPDTNEECSPKPSKRGKYLMYPISVSGRDKNNYHFSLCSLMAMESVLKAKADCFVTGKQAFCGNFRVEDDEQCDAGVTSASTDIGNKCCDRNCKLKPNAVCSSANQACCSEDCQIISNTSYPCFLPREDDCFETTFCDGTSSVCPAFRPKPDGSACSSRGQCQNGVCIPLCQLFNYESCMCDEMIDGCKWCCIHGNGKCQPLVTSDTVIYLPEGMVCVGGLCDDKGICTEKVRGIVSRLWELLDLSSPGALVRFMRNNYVPTIIVLTLLIWLPAGCYICYLDRRAKRERLKILAEVVGEVLDGKLTGLLKSMTVPDTTLRETVRKTVSAPQEAALRDTIRKITVEINNSLPDDDPSTSQEQTSVESPAVSKQEPKEDPAQEHSHSPEHKHKHEHKREDADEHVPKHTHKDKHERAPENKLESTDEPSPSPKHKHRHKHGSRQSPLKDAGKDLKDNDT